MKIIVELDDLKRLIASARTNPYFGDSDDSLDYFERLVSAVETAEDVNDA